MLSLHNFKPHFLMLKHNYNQLHKSTKLYNNKFNYKNNTTVKYQNNCRIINKYKIVYHNEYCNWKSNCNQSNFN